MSSTKVLLDGKKISADDYADRLLNNYGFEKICVRCRQDFCLRHIAQKRPDIIVEAGCGAELLAARMREIDHIPALWVTIEPSAQFATHARNFAQSHPWYHVVEGFLENVIADVLKKTSGAADTILLSSILHETYRPDLLLESAKRCANLSTTFCVTVPNANSFHRLLAQHMNLISTPSELSDRNRSLGQPVVFDLETLKSFLNRHGLEAGQPHGYLFKPFTHEQMQQLVDHGDTRMVDALDKLGQQFPHNAAEIGYYAHLQKNVRA